MTNRIAVNYIKCTSHILDIKDSVYHIIVLMVFADYSISIIYLHIKIL